MKDDLTPRERKRVVSVEPVTSKTQDAQHDKYCAPCRVWYAKEKPACPSCGRSLLLG